MTSKLDKFMIFINPSFPLKIKLWQNFCSQMSSTCGPEQLYPPEHKIINKCIINVINRERSIWAIKQLVSNNFDADFNPRFKFIYKLDQFWPNVCVFLSFSTTDYSFRFP